MRDGDMAEGGTGAWQGGLGDTTGLNPINPAARSGHLARVLY